MESFVVPTSWIQWYTLYFKDVYVLFHSFAEMLIDTVMFVILVVLNEYVCDPQLMVLLFMVYTARLLQQVPARHSILHLLQVN
jgi:hypothetical protein